LTSYPAGDKKALGGEVTQKLEAEKDKLYGNESEKQRAPDYKRKAAVRRK